MDFLLNLDKSLLYYVNAVWTHPWLNVFFPLITDLHKFLWFKILVVPMMLTLFVWRYRKTGVWLFLGLLLSLGLSDLGGNHLFKKTFSRLRPGDVPGNSVIVRSPYGGFSFISNHAANMFCLAKYTSEFIPQVAVPFYALAFLVSYSRVYNGVHYPSDVAMGGLLGWLIGWLMSFVIKWALAKYKKRTVL
jgi:undecaprenyl-diphosphatase